MTDAYIVSALRTPVGRKKGSLASVHPADLGAIPLKETFNRISLDPALVEDVISVSYTHLTLPTNRDV